MALSAKVTNHTSSASGSLAYTGVGFQPSAVMIMWGMATAIGNAVRATMGVGLAASSSDQRALHFWDNDNVSPSTVANWKNAGKMFGVYELSGGSPNRLDEGNLTSFDSDGFTINHTTVTAQRKFSALSLAGSDLTNIKTGVLGIGTSITSISITGVGFQPDCVLFFTPSAGANDTDASGLAANATVGMGWCDTAFNQAVVCTRHAHNVNPTVSRRVLRSDACIKFLSNAGGQGQAAVTAWGSDGFTLNVTEVGASSFKVYYIALKGGSYKAGVFNGNTSTGSQAITGAGFAPKAMMIQTACQTTSTSNSAEARRGFGWGTSSAQRGYIAYGSRDAQSTTINDHRIRDDKIIGCITEGTPTLDDEADLTSLDSDGFTLNWTTVSGTAKEYAYLLMGDNTSAPTGQPYGKRHASVFGHLGPRAPFAGVY